jgi:hypothetical protein
VALRHVLFSDTLLFVTRAASLVASWAVPGSQPAPPFFGHYGHYGHGAHPPGLECMTIRIPTQ